MGTRWSRPAAVRKASTCSRQRRSATSDLQLLLPIWACHTWMAAKWREAVKNESPSTPVILLTGWGQRLVAEGDIPPHVDRVLNKPPKLRELRAALAELASGSPMGQIAPR